MNMEANCSVPFMAEQSIDRNATYSSWMIAQRNRRRSEKSNRPISSSKAPQPIGANRGVNRAGSQHYQPKDKAKLNTSNLGRENQRTVNSNSNSKSHQPLPKDMEKSSKPAATNLPNQNTFGSRFNILSDITESGEETIGMDLENPNGDTYEGGEMGSGVGSNIKLEGEVALHQGQGEGIRRGLSGSG